MAVDGGVRPPGRAAGSARGGGLRGRTRALRDARMSLAAEAGIVQIRLGPLQEANRAARCGRTHTTADAVAGMVRIDFGRPGTLYVSRAFRSGRIRPVVELEVAGVAVDWLVSAIWGPLSVLAYCA